MAAPDNPFTLVYTTLWDLPLSHWNFNEIVKPGNRIRYDSDTQRDPAKDVVAAADVPELILVCNSGQVNMNNTSSSSMVTRQYTWLVSTGDYRVNEYLHQVEWALFISMLKWKDILCALQWHGKSFVKRAAIVGITNGESDSERNRGLKGWSAVWSAEVEMHFATADLLSELVEPEP